MHYLLFFDREPKVSALIGYVILLPRIFSAIATSTKNLLESLTLTADNSDLGNVDDEKNQI